ncbi:DUF418 domain-containing protein [Virgibacillus sp. Bac332]|uniref:DUF418 domain-containing protein n=1 Tax=Virgibacillus sp. Bac332 TaxID=2419842 RepID=UPI001F094D66|nr:DUF418 domain-containing protein [Virgibacillus sp. Bac332]
MRYEAEREYMMDIKATPTREKDRLVWIDAARGFAIFGIFIVNIGAFSAPYFLYGGEGVAWPSSLDHTVQGIIDIFFQASFYSLFSILFGFGIQLMKEGLFVKGIAFYPILIRRLMVLIGFGIIHAFLIWHGDILLSYGIIGLFLLLFLDVKDRTLLGWGVTLLVGSVSMLTLFLYNARHFLNEYDDVMINQALENYQSTTIQAIWYQNFQDWMYGNGGIVFFIMIATILPLFLFGMYIARKRWLHKPKQYHSIIKRLWFSSLILFILLKLAPYLFGNPTWFSMIQDNIGGSFSALFYLTSITLLAQTKVGAAILQPLVYVGRMALTNYITQSVICFVLFYGVGLGLYGAISPLIGVLMVIVIYFLQIIYSKWWFIHFRFGPLEWIWRSLTYNQKQYLRRKNQG